MTIQLQQIIQDVVRRVPEVMPYLSPNVRAVLAQAKAVKAAGDYASIRDTLWNAIFDAVEGFLTSGQQVGTPVSAMTTALSQAYIEAADTAYEDGGGTLPLDDDTAAWARAELDAQFGYVDSLFQTLKALRKEGDFDATVEAGRRADGYAQSLDMLYGGAKMRAAGNTMLTFDGDDGKESCADCQRYKGQRHRASWWVAHGAIPPSRDFECKGYNCFHRLYDDDGNEFTT
ncbi:MAG TPA: hypothetical protein VFU31_05430 [Candidatus Binatia bacterium]|nr:hypothetical protein [Candidatus Binatia bacterium]